MLWLVGWSDDKRDTPFRNRDPLWLAYAQAVVAQTLHLRNPFRAVVVCGRNHKLTAEITTLVAAQADRYRVRGYTSDMPDLMRVATLFVGKPGACHRRSAWPPGCPL